MKKNILFTFFMCVVALGTLCAQKTVFTPTEWNNTNHEFYNRMSPDRMYQSANFVLYWGDLVGTNPQTASDANLRFNPQAVADTFEFIFRRYITDLKFINNAATTNFGKYKTPVIILGTFSGNDDRTTGFAHASSYSNTIGAMFVHPAAVKDGGAISHEYAHALQMMMHIQENPGNGNAFAGYDWAGPFFEGHANFMRAQVYQKWANIDGTLTRWIQTRHFMWSSNRHHYTNYNLLFYVQEKEGFDFTRRMWAESRNQEHPLETIKRLKGFTQEQLNDYLWGYAAKDVTFDYPIQWNSQINQTGNFGQVMRATYQGIRNSMPRYTSRQYTLLTKVAGTSDQYYTNDDWAPQDYGMNIIPLYPTCSGNQKKVTVKFKGHTEVNPTQAGWRYGFVTTKANGTVSRYSPMYAAAEGEASFTLDAATESGIFFVVFSAPKTHVNYNMDVGYPKQRRYPYELKIANANPEGYQPATEFRSFLKTNGRIHANGGGWVSNNANVAASVYVGPYAMVRGGTVSGSARIEDWATVDGGNISGNAIVRGNAWVYNATLANNAIAEGNAWMEGGSVRDNAIVRGNAMLFAGNYTGTVVVGGDAEIGSCASGVYLQFPYWRNGRTNCDGKGATDASNLDINATFTNFSPNQMAFATTPTCTDVVLPDFTLTTSVTGSGSITPNSGTYVSGSAVSLTASPAQGFNFTGWGGDASGTSNPFSLIMNSNKNVIANFAPIPVHTLNYSLEMLPMADYTSTAVQLNTTQIGQFFGLTPAQITSNMGSSITYYAANPNGSLDANSTANAPGHWFTNSGQTTPWGDNAYVYSEINTNTWVANIGQYPNRAVVGEELTIRQALVYMKSPTETIQVNLIFNIQIKGGLVAVSDNNSTEQQLEAYPNPTSGKIQLSKSEKWILSDQYGKQLNTGLAPEIDLSNYATGVYFIQVNEKTIKVIKE